MILSRILQHFWKVLGHTPDKVPYNSGRKDTSGPRAAHGLTTILQGLGSIHRMTHHLRSPVDILRLVLMGEISQDSINPDIGELRFLVQRLQQDTTMNNLIRQHFFRLHTAQKRPT